MSIKNNNSHWNHFDKQRDAESEEINRFLQDGGEVIRIGKETKLDIRTEQKQKNGNFVPILSKTERLREA